MLVKLKRWIIKKVIQWVEYEEIVITARGTTLTTLYRNSSGEVVKDSAYWSSVASVLHNKPFINEVELFIKAKELWVRQGAYEGENSEELARRDAYFRGARSFRTMIDRANAQYTELTRGSNG